MTEVSGKSRKHYSRGEPYFCEQFNTCYTHKFTAKTASGKEVSVFNSLEAKRIDGWLKINNEIQINNCDFKCLFNNLKILF